MNDPIENHDELAHIETMSAEELRLELRDAIEFHRECLVENWHEKKQLKADIQKMQVTLRNGIDTMNNAERLVTMWRRSCYGLTFIVMVLLCCVGAQGGDL